MLPPSQAQARARSWRSLMGAVLPWLIAMAALGWVVHLVRWHQLAGALERIHLVSYVAVSLVAIALNWLADTFAMWRAFALFGDASTFREMLVLRGRSYVLAAFHYAMGQAAVVGFLYRRGAPLARATGWLLFVTAVNFGTLLVLTASGALATGLTHPFVRLVVVATIVLCAGYATLLVVRPRRLAKVPVLDALFDAGVVGHARALLVRLPHVAVLIAWNAYSLRAFGVDVPVSGLVALLPAVIFTAALPVSAQGLGLSQAASVFLFARYGGTDGRASVLASSLCMSSIAIVAQLALGFAMGAVPGHAGRAADV